MKKICISILLCIYTINLYPNTNERSGSSIEILIGTLGAFGNTMFLRDTNWVYLPYNEFSPSISFGYMYQFNNIFSIGGNITLNGVAISLFCGHFSIYPQFPFISDIGLKLCFGNKVDNIAASLNISTMFGDTLFIGLSAYYCNFCLEFDACILDQSAFVINDDAFNFKLLFGYSIFYGK